VQLTFLFYKTINRGYNTENDHHHCLLLLPHILTHGNIIL